MYLGFSFEKGGNLSVELCDKTPHTLRTLSKILPLESEARHTRWCGREVYFPICTRQTPCRENQTSTVSKFDVAYWTEWDIHANPPGSLNRGNAFVLLRGRGSSFSWGSLESERHRKNFLGSRKLTRRDWRESLALWI